MAAFHAARSALQPFLTGCASGRELIERGFAQDIALAAQLDASATVPILDGAALVAWTGCPDR